MTTRWQSSEPSQPRSGSAGSAASALACAVVAGLSLTWSGSPAHGQSPALAACIAAKTPDDRIRACTTVIADGASPGAAIAYNFRGVAWHDKQSLDRALADFDASVQLDPSNANARNNRGIALQAKGDLDRAIVEHSAAIGLDAKDANGAYRFRSIAWRLKGDVNRAVADASEAIRLYPDYNAAYVARGLAFEEKHEIARAHDDYSLALAMPAKYLSGPQAHYEARELLAALDAGTSASLRRARPGVRLVRRVALVIGNNDYRAARKLRNPANDAIDLAELLRRLGFDVLQGQSLDRRGMADLIAEFGRRLAGADLALFYYAGHGIQVAGRNYLLPVDVRLERGVDLARDALEIGEVLSRLEAEKRVSLIFLDACRDDPTGGRLGALAAGTGLAAVRGQSGTLIAYATQPGNVALDGDERNSPFSAALLRHLASPGLDIGLIMRRVRAQVVAHTRERQVPWEHSSLLGEVVLVR